MRDAEEWVSAYTQSGAFDLLDSIKDAVELIKEIQDDAFMYGISSMLQGEDYE